jgi:hypothetical protein
MSSKALNTSDAEMLLCCLEVETSCALVVLRQKTHTKRLSIIMQTYVAAASTCINKRGRCGCEGARTEVVDKHRCAFDKGEYRVLLQLHIFGDL